MLKRLPVVLVLLVLVGCAGGGLDRNRVQGLQSSIDNYIAALRWSRVEEAMTYHRDRDGGRPLHGPEAMDSIRVTGHDIREKTLNADLTGASVTAEVEYYNEAYGTVKTLTLEQDWWYDEDSRRWYLSNTFPEFR